MRTSACLLLGLALMVTMESEAQPIAVDNAVPEICCFSFIDFQIPVKKVKSAESTGPACTQKAVVITTEKGNKFCVKADEQWLKKIKMN